MPTGGAYRNERYYLFQPIAATKYLATLGQGDYGADNWGPSYNYIDNYSGWAWARAGGDWIDSAGTAQGTLPWASFDANSASGEGAVFRYTGVDVTRLVKYCFDNTRWAAFILRTASGGQPRGVASLFTTGQLPPVISVSYTDSTTATLACRIVAADDGSSALPNTIGQNTYLPVFVEFDRPTKAVASASMAITVTSHYGGPSSRVDLFLLNPPGNSQPTTGAGGLASLAGNLDAGIVSVPNVVGAQRYVDGTALSDFVATGSAQGNANFNDEAFFSPEFWGGAVDTSKWPYTITGKWLASPTLLTGWSLVSSSYVADGFEPLAPGLGALRVAMPDSGLTTGQEGGYSGTLAAFAKIFMPPAEMGLMNHLFVRYYIRLGLPYARSPANLREVRQSGVPKWTAMGGKFGIAPSHTTSYGAFSGSSGGRFGWQMRHAWYDCEAGPDGPLKSGLIPGWHLYDFQDNNPAGHRYGGESQRQHNWGQMGGLGGVLYAGRWYCIETELKLNSVNAPSAAGDGYNWTPDGELRTWIDGRLTYERTGLVFRTTPVYNPGRVADQMRPMRELGIKDLLWNWYNGGTLPNMVDRSTFTCGLVWAKSRIGPMKGLT